MSKNLKLYSAAATFLMICTATAQGTRVCMGGNFEHLTSAQRKACESQVAQVRKAADQYSAGNWHFIVVCDEQGWRDYAAFSNTPAEQLANANADTNFGMRTTFLRGSRLTGPAGSTVLAMEMNAIAHPAVQPLTQVAANR